MCLGFLPKGKVLLKVCPVSPSPTCIVWESLAWPKISSKAGSEMKKKREKMRRLPSRYLKKYRETGLLLSEDRHFGKQDIHTVQS